MSYAADTSRDLRTDRDRYVAFAFSGADLLVEVDVHGRIRYVSGASRHITGREPAELLEMRFSELAYQDDRKFVETLLAGLGDGSRLDPVKLRMHWPNGQIMSTVLGGCRLPKREICFYLTLSTSRVPLVERALDVRRDENTGLLTAEDFERRAEETLRVARAGGGDVKLTLLELGDLPGFGERLGKDLAEDFMSDIGAFLRSQSVTGDAAGRLDDQHFGLLHRSDLDTATITKKVDALARERDPSGPGLVVEGRSMALGDPNLGINDAATALSYAIKEFAEHGAGAFRMTSVNDSLQAVLKTTVERVSAIRSMVAKKDFKIVFQPIVSLATRQLHHYEVLTRFSAEDSPFETIRFAEGVNIISDFDLALCQLTVEMVAARSARGERHEVAMNISGRSLVSRVFIDALRDLLEPHNAIRSQFIFEITESTQIEDLELATNIVKQLRADGHSICLDDFGAGASSFPYLQALPVDYVKIDGAYVRKVLNEDRDRTILRGMVWLCKELKIATVAEMIETEEQANILRAFGIEYGQGWLFGKPLTELPTLEKPLIGPGRPTGGSGNGRFGDVDGRSSSSVHAKLKGGKDKR